MPGAVGRDVGGGGGVEAVVEGPGRLAGRDGVAREGEAADLLARVATRQDPVQLLAFEALGAGVQGAAPGGRLVGAGQDEVGVIEQGGVCLLYTSPSPRDRQKSRMPS
ncbi:hypothetical protein, partial [Streptomyces novaecaesareae]|uniref:hypothetical protein n=1 Tax=Streptomyces novaecaesareae TaxID=68244 RepID=UPI00315918D8